MKIMKKASIRDRRTRTGRSPKKSGVVIPKVGRLTVGEAFRDLERQGYFVRIGRTNSNIDKFISEDRSR